MMAIVTTSGVGLGPREPLDVFGDVPTFTLTDQLERTVNTETLRGKVVVANFIYTSCRDICPQLSTQMQAFQDRLRGENLLGTEVQLLSFTVDPERDTPAVLRAYAERHGADPDAWRFLTGPKETIVPLIVDGFHLGVQVLPPAEASPSSHDPGTVFHDTYEVMHSGRFVLIDRAGRIRAYFDGREFDPERILVAIRNVSRPFGRIRVPNSGAFAAPTPPDASCPD